MQSEYRHRRTGRRRRKRNYNIDEMKDWKDEKLKDEKLMESGVNGS